MRDTKHDSTRCRTDTRFSESLRERPTAEAVPALTVLSHPDVHRVGERVPLPRLAAREPVELSRNEPLFAQPEGGRPRGLGVSYVSRKPLRLTASPTDFLLERADSSTPVQVDGRPFDQRLVVSLDDLHRGVVLELGRRVVLLFHLCPAVPETGPRLGLVGASGAVEELRREIALAAGADTSVLLRGASGTGKELVARAVHEAGARRNGPWVAVNMAAVPPSLAAAELFGSLRGAFTGADRERQGYFGAAHGGTLFLDEIGDTPAEVQPLLLRALENGEVQPVGSAQSRRVDVRVIAATDVDLENRIADGRFRTPLLHRLAGFEIRLPTLAERRDDIGRLLTHFLDQELGGLRPLAEAADAVDERPWPPAPLVAALAAYSWPGNVRQLANVARRLALAQRAGREVELDALRSLLHESSESLSISASEPETAAASAIPEPRAREQSADPGSPTGLWRPVFRQASEVAEEELLQALRAARFRLAPTAEALGVSRSVLYKLIDDCPRVRKAADLDRDEIERALTDHPDEADAAQSLEVSLHGLRLRMHALGLRRQS